MHRLENRLPTRFLHVQDGPLSCSVALRVNGDQLRLASSGSSDFCDSVSTRLTAAGRHWNSLLSAEQFQQWRHSLDSKKDSVHSSGAFVEVSTTTGQGVLREASLRLRLSDYQPVAGHYEFSGTEPLILDVEEDHAAEEMAATQQALAARQSQLSASPADPEQHALVIRSMRRRHRSVWHCIRPNWTGTFFSPWSGQHGNIRVWGAVPSEADRTSAETALNHLAHVNVALLTQAEEQEQRRPLPWSSYQGDDVPLAEETTNGDVPGGRRGASSVPERGGCGDAPYRRRGKVA